MSFRKMVMTGVFIILSLLFSAQRADAGFYFCDSFLDEAVSQNYWTFDKEYDIATYNETAGLVEFNTINSGEGTDIVSKYCLIGNFDVTMRYQAWSVDAALNPSGDVAPAYIGLAITTLESYYLLENDEDPLDFVYLMRLEESAYGGDYYFVTTIFDGITDNIGMQETTDTEGVLKISRQDGSVYLSSYSPVENVWYNWEPFGSNFTEPLVVGAIVYSGAAPLLAGGFQVAADYIVVQGDEMTPMPVPEPATLLLLTAGLFSIAAAKIPRRK